MKLRKILIFLLVLLVLLVLLFVTNNLFPYYLQHHYLPQLAKKNGLNLLSLQVDKIGLSKVSLSRIEIGNSEKNSFSIDSLLLNFNHLLFKQREIKEVLLSGVNIIALEKNGSLSIAGLPKKPEKNTKASKREITNIQETLSQFPIQIKKFTIRNSSIHLVSNNKTHTSIFNAELDTIDYQNASLKGVISVLWDGKHMDLSGNVDLSKNHFSVDVISDDIQLTLPSTYISTPDDIFGSCLFDMNGHIAGTVSPFVPTYRTNLSLQNISFQKKDTQFSIENTASESLPVQVEISGDTNSMKATIVHLKLKKPYPVRLDNLHMLIDFHDTGMSGNGATVMKLPIVSNQQTVPTQFIDLTQEIDFNIVDKKWQFKTKFTEAPRTNKEKQEISYYIDNLKIESTAPTLLVSGTGDKNSAKLHFNATVKSLILTEADAGLKMPNGSLKISTDIIEAEGRIVFSNRTAPHSVWGDVQLSGNNVAFTSERLQAKSNLHLSTDISYDFAKTTPEIQVHGDLKIHEATAFLPLQEIEIVSVSAAIPLQWPLDQKKSTTGNFAFKNIKNKSYNFGDITGEIDLTETNYHITSLYSSRMLDNFSAYMNGSIDISTFNNPKANLTVTVPKYAFNSNNAFLKEHITDLDFSGIFDLKAILDMGPRGFSGNAAVTVSETNLFHKENNINVSGIKLKIPFPDINTMKSSTASLNFDTAQLGEIKLHGGKAFFQIESEKSLLIERSSLNWANGHVDIMGTRIKKGLDEQNITLYCNGLALAEILTQSGISSVSGKGKVNGKIPLILEDGKLRFEDAFLYSTPGTGGSIKIRNSNILLAGIPKNTLQYAQLDFAGEALKQFNYNWVTLDLKSIQEDAILAMKLDGKPAAPLPFRYDSGSGAFIRLPPESKGIDYPISLDVNFHLPLNKIINYGTYLKNIL